MTGGRGTVLAAAATLAALLPASVGAAEEGAFAIESGGSIRTIVAGADNFDEPLLFGEGNSADGFSQAIPRLTLEGTGPGHSFEIHLVQDVAVAAGRGGTPGSAGVKTSALRSRLVEGGWEQSGDDDLRAVLEVDRAQVSLSAGRFDIVAGRQAITFSQAYFWNPLDVFLPFNPETFDRSYKPGVDALRVDLALGAFSSLTFVASPGRKLSLLPAGGGLAVEGESFSDEPWYGSTLLLRGRTTVGHFDVTFQAGKVYGGYQAGGGFSGEAGPVGIRGEGTWLFADGEDALGDALGGPEPLVTDHAKAVIGVDYRFDGGLYLNGEYFYNGAGADGLEEAAARVAVGETPNLSEHLLGIQASRELHPLLTGQLLWIHSLGDGSDLLSPSFSWSAADEAELVFGAILARGRRPALLEGGEGLALKSEFGTYPHLYFVEMIYYF